MVKEGKTIHTFEGVDLGLSCAAFLDLVGAKVGLDKCYLKVLAKGKVLPPEEGVAIAAAGLKNGSKLTMMFTEEYHQDKELLGTLQALSLEVSGLEIRADGGAEGGVVGSGAGGSSSGSGGKAGVARGGRGAPGASAGAPLSSSSSSAAAAAAAAAPSARDRVILEEQLTALLESIDGVDTLGRPSLRATRKRLVQRCQDASARNTARLEALRQEEKAAAAAGGGSGGGSGGGAGRAAEQQPPPAGQSTRGGRSAI